MAFQSRRRTHLAATRLNELFWVCFPGPSAQAFASRAFGAFPSPAEADVCLLGRANLPLKCCANIKPPPSGRYRNAQTQSRCQSK